METMLLVRKQPVWREEKHRMHTLQRENHSEVKAVSKNRLHNK
jgi:hypothetical protein